MERPDDPLTPALAEARFTSQRAHRRRIEVASTSGARWMLRGAMLGLAALGLDVLGPAAAALGVAPLGALGAACGLFGGVRLLAAFALSRRAAP